MYLHKCVIFGVYRGVDMHRSEWLDEAKRVPVGQSRRVQHGAEGRKNLVVFNNTDSWSAYCHSCKEGGKVLKEYLEPVDTTAPVYRKYLDTRSLVHPSALDKAKITNLVLMLHEKRMSLAVLAKHKPMYNTVDDRLVFRFKGVDLGRDCTGRSNAKWLHYHRDDPSEYVYLQGKVLKDYEPVVLVEDLFSAIKVNHYTGWSTLCCLGTRITDEIIRTLSSLVRPIDGSTTGTERVQRVAVAAFDGDSAGLAAERSLINRLGLRGLPFRTVRIPTGLDPKDLNPAELLAIFKFLEDLNV